MLHSGRRTLQRLNKHIELHFSRVFETRRNYCHRVDRSTLLTRKCITASELFCETYVDCTVNQYLCESAYKHQTLEEPFSGATKIILGETSSFRLIRKLDIEEPLHPILTDEWTCTYLTRSSTIIP